MLLEQATTYREQYGLHTVHLLLTSMYGPREAVDGGPVPSLIKRILEAKANGAQSVIVWGTGNATRDFLYVEEAARGIVLAAENYDGFQPVNIGSGCEVAIRELAEMIAKLIGYHGVLVFDAAKPEGPTRRILDNSLAEKLFGFHNEITLEVGLQKTIDWYNQQT